MSWWRSFLAFFQIDDCVSRTWVKEKRYDRSGY